MPKQIKKKKFQKDKQKQFLTKVVSSILLFGLILYTGYSIFAIVRENSKASGLTPTVTPSVQNVSTSGAISLSFVSTANLNTGSTITFTYQSGYVGTLTTANTTINSIAPSSITITSPSGYVNNSLTVASNIPSGSTVTVSTSALTTPSSAANYAFSVQTSTGDYGANFQYVGQANVVQITGFIPITLSFVIRTVADSANTNVCNLGTATTTSVATCQYRLKVTTNAKNGYTVSMQASGGLTNGSDILTNSAPGFGGTGGTNIVPGSESYGVVVTPGNSTSSGGSILAANLFDAGLVNSVRYDYNVPTLLLTANKPNNPAAFGATTNTTLITHNLAITPGSPSGNFTQTITYTVAPSF